MTGSIPGPPPKRAAERNRRNVPAGPELTQLTPEQLDDLPFDVELLVEPPEPAEWWHRGATMQYEALLRDPARIWMGPAAWALAWVVCETISRELQPQVVGIIDGGYDPETGEKVAGHVAKERVPMKAATLGAVLKWAATVGINEGDRLSMRKEVTFGNAPSVATDATDEEVAETREGWFVVEGGEA